VAWRVGRAELLLAFGSVGFLLLLLGIAELAVRAFSDVDLLGNSRDLFVANAYGNSHGNAKNAVGSSFGMDVYTDEYGFRVPKGGLPGDAGKGDAILILGDSVGFGPAVEEPETLTGLLRARFPERRVYNSSSIAYTAHDYRNVVENFLPQHPEVTAVVLVYCLNDVSRSSAQNIDRQLGKQPETPEVSRFTETLRSFRLLSDANDYLRSRSKLYLFVRHRLLQTQTRDWKLLLSLYGDDRAADYESALSDVVAVAEELRAKGIPLVLVLSPFEYQLRRPDDPESELPQRLITERLTRAGVAYIDPRPDFDASHASTEYFLGYDPMHFSALGHRVMADAIARALAR